MLKLRFEDGNDLVRTRIDDDDLVADHDIVVASPLGIDHEHFHWQWIKTYVRRHPRSHPVVVDWVDLAPVAPCAAFSPEVAFPSPLPLASDEPFTAAPFFLPIAPLSGALRSEAFVLSPSGA